MVCVVENIMHQPVPAAEKQFTVLLGMTIYGAYAITSGSDNAGERYFTPCTRYKSESIWR